MADEAFQNANQLFDDEAYAEALELYNAAVKAEPTKVEYLLKRAACHLKLKSYPAAIADASACIQREPNNNTAYLRKGIAEFSSGELDAALSSLETAAAKGNKQTDLWLRKVKAEFALEAKVTGAAAPKPAPAPAKASPTPAAAAGAGAAASSSGAAAAAAAPAVASGSVAGAAADNSMAAKMRIQWFQSRETVAVTLYVKGLKRTDVDVKVDGRVISARVVCPDASVFERRWELYADIAPGKTEIDVNPFKAEITFAKAVAGDWVAYEATAPAAIAVSGAELRPNTHNTPVDPKAYPTSNKKKADVDWQAEELKAKKDEEDEKVEGEAALHKLFQKIYSNASEDTRRAMVKSYQTSGGTVLSTNWKEVATKDYEKDRQAPKGQEFRNWNA